MRVLGITGGIGSGKSVVSQILRAQGYAVYDTDSHAKRIMQTSSVLRSALQAHFGEAIYSNGVLDRKRLAEAIFSSEVERKFVNSQVHPFVVADFVEWVQRLGSTCKVAFVESAILYESGLVNCVDGVIYVTAPLEVRIDRVMNRDSASQEQVSRRIASQQGEAEAERRANWVVVNDEQHSLIAQVDAVLRSLL